MNKHYPLIPCLSITEIINTKLYEEITQNNNDLIKKIDKLKIENLDLDYLEEINIKKNGIVNKNDILIVNSNNN